MIMYLANREDTDICDLTSVVPIILTYCYFVKQFFEDSFLFHNRESFLQLELDCSKPSHQSHKGIHFLHRGI